MYGGRIRLVNRWRWPPASTRLSLTRGARTSSVPAPQVTFRACAWPLRTTSRRPCSSRSSACSSTYCATSTARAFMSIRRAPSRASSSSVGPSACSSVATSLSSTFNMGGVSFPGQPAGVSRCHAEGYAAFFTLGIHNFRSYLAREKFVSSLLAARARIRRNIQKIAQSEKLVRKGGFEAPRPCEAQVPEACRFLARSCQTVAFRACLSRSCPFVPVDGRLSRNKL